MNASISSANFEIWDVADIMARPLKPIDWLISEIWPAGTHSDIYGPPESGKSTILWSQIIAIATGQNWFGKKVKQGRVLVVGGEFTDQDWAARSICRFLKDKPFPNDMIKVLPNTGPMFRLNRDGEWIKTAAGKHVDEVIDKFQPLLVVIDTAAMLGMVDGSNYSATYDLAIQFQKMLDHHKKPDLPITGTTVSHTNQSSQGKDEALSWRLNYMSRNGGYGYPGRLRIMHSASTLRDTDEVAKSTGLDRRIREGGKFIAYGVSKCSEIATPTWHFTSPAIFEMMKDEGGLLLVKDGSEISDAVAKANKQSIENAPAHMENIGEMSVIARKARRLGLEVRDGVF